MRKVFFVLIPLFLGLWAGVAILPYHFSPQKPLVIESLTGEFDSRQTNGEYLGREVTSPFAPDIASTFPDVLGSSESDKRIEVDLTSQRLYAYEGNTKVYDFLISSGKWGRTPTGTFRIWTKLRYTKMEGGSKALRTYYYLPNVPYVMYFSNDEIPSWRGFGLHGTYWHNNFGHPMSHGCVNMKTEDAALLYQWANPVLGDKRSVRATQENPGTTIIIYGTAPAS